MNLGVPKSSAKPVKETPIKKIEILPSLFLKLPEAQLSSTQKVYNIKWFASDNEFKGKETDLTIGTILGKGSFATVYEALDRTVNRTVAVKIFDKRMLKDKSKRKEVQDELNIVSKLDHPNIIKLLRVVEDVDKVYIVMDNWGKTSLEESISQATLDKSKSFKLFSQLVDAVQYLHSRNVFHRHIKLTNIMHKDGKICLLDFGLSTSSNYVREFLYCGTPTYMAPEMLNKNGYEGSWIDVWCLGVCIFKGLAGKYPFGGKLCPNLRLQ